MTQGFRAQKPRPRRAGQTFLMLVWMVAALVVLLLVAFDIFFAARAKMRLISTGDAAALAAARGQATTLNLIGDLNLAHLAALCDAALPPEDMTNVIDGVNALAERLAFAGPVLALDAANLAARRNRSAAREGDLADDADFSRIIRSEAEFARASLAPTPFWPAKGADYAAMLEAVLAQGVCVGCDNARLLSSGATGNHLYYVHGFYDAAVHNGAKQWFCRYYGYDHAKAIAMLRHFSPPGVEELGVTGDGAAFENAGFFGCGVAAAAGFRAWGDVNDPEGTLARLFEYYAPDSPVTVTAGGLRESGALYDARFPWYFLAPETFWRDWREIAAATRLESPLLSDVRPEYGVYGAQAAVRVNRTLVPVAETGARRLAWMAAAKPFGALFGDTRVTDLFGPWEGDQWQGAPLVAPAFSFVRLVPLGGVGAGNLYKADAAWLDHLAHLRAHTRRSECSYCQILNHWETVGADDAAWWLSEHAHDEVCLPPGEGRSYDDDDFAN